MFRKSFLTNSDSFFNPVDGFTKTAMLNQWRQKSTELVSAQHNRAEKNAIQWRNGSINILGGLDRFECSVTILQNNKYCITGAQERK